MQPALMKVSAKFCCFLGNIGPTVSNKPYAEVEVPIGDYVDVMPTSVVSPDQFCCQLFEKSDVIDEMMAELENAYKNSQAPRNMQLRNGMPCVALYPGNRLRFVLHCMLYVC